jgi:hypothetical protein
MQRLLKAVSLTSGEASDRIFDGHFVNCRSSTHSILSREMSILRHRIFVIRSGQPTIDCRHGDHVLNAVIAPKLQEIEPASGQETLKQRSRKVEADEIRSMVIARRPLGRSISARQRFGGSYRGGQREPLTHAPAHTPTATPPQPTIPDCAQQDPQPPRVRRVQATRPTTTW